MRVSGRLETVDGHTALVDFKVDEGKLSIRSGRRPIGSWPLREISFERTSLFRFRMVVEDEAFHVIPDDATAFAQAVGAIVDLRQGRYGLSARIEESSRQRSPR
ncbi:MAG: hypothetical protein ACE5MI_04265 [Acidimicrobiia bacterium]